MKHLNIKTKHKIINILLGVLLINLVAMLDPPTWIGFFTILLITMSIIFNAHYIYVWFKSRNNVIFKEVSNMLKCYEKSEKIESFYTFFRTYRSQNNLSDLTVDFIKENTPTIAPYEWQFFDDYKNCFVVAYWGRLNEL